MRLSPSPLPFLVFASVAVVACRGGRGLPTPKAPERPAIERDLAVVVVYGGGGVEDADAPWPIQATLVNRGPSAHFIVEPHDGSGAGWREPHVFYSAEIELAPGVWRPVAARRLARCGNYASAWMRDVRSLAAGESLVLEDLYDPSSVMEFPQSGTVRLVAHYEYGGGRIDSFDWPGDGRWQTQPALPDELGASGPFAIASAPIVIRVQVDTSLAIEVTPRRRRIRVDESVALEDLVDAMAVSRSADEIGLAHEIFGSGFDLEVEPNDGFWSAAPQSLEGPARLAPHARSAVRAPNDRVLARRVAGPVRLRIVYEGLRTEHALRRAKSRWITVDVAP